MKRRTKFVLSVGILLAIFIIFFGIKNSDNDRNSTSLVSQGTTRTIEINSLPPSAKILFMSDRDTNTRRKEIYAMDKNGENVQRMTNSDTHHFFAAVDNSRRFIVDTRAEANTAKPADLGDEDRKSVWLIDLEKRTETLLSDPRYNAESRTFSPDSEWVAFLMSVNNQGDIYKVRRDGTDLVNLTNTPRASEGDPAWSPDGKWISYSYADGDLNRYVLKRMSPTGTNIETIYDGGEGIPTPGFAPGNYDPAWSPDSEWLVFERAVSAKGENFKSGVWHIFRVKTDGTDILDLSLKGNHEEWAEFLPSISPDGTRVIFSALHQAKDLAKSFADIFVMDANTGGNIERLTNNSGGNMFGTWIP